MDEYTASLIQTADQIMAQIPCRVCGQKRLKAFVQPGVGSRPAVIQVDCRNPDCKIFTVTHDFDEWCTFDVSVWHGAEELPGWTAEITALATTHNAARNDARERPATLCDLVETFIRQQEGIMWDVVLRDFREQMRDALPYRRHQKAEEWLHVYTRKGA